MLSGCHTDCAQLQIWETDLEGWIYNSVPFQWTWSDLDTHTFTDTHVHKLGGERMTVEMNLFTIHTVKERHVSLTDLPVFFIPRLLPPPPLHLCSIEISKAGKLGLRGLRLGQAFLWKIDLCCACWVKRNNLTEPVMPILDAMNDNEEEEEGSDECILHPSRSDPICYPRRARARARLGEKQQQNGSKWENGNTKYTIQKIVPIYSYFAQF